MKRPSDERVRKLQEAVVESNRLCLAAARGEITYAKAVVEINRCCEGRVTANERPDLAKG